MASNSHHHPQYQHQSYSHSPPNPLRPYYIPPPPPLFDSSPPPAPTPTPGPSFSPSSASASAAAAAAAAAAAPSSYAILQDFKDYSEDYIDNPSVGEAMRNFLDQAILQYTSILIKQPFEVAKTVLQCQYVPSSRREGKGKHYNHPRGSGANDGGDASAGAGAGRGGGGATAEDGDEGEEADSDEEEKKQADAEENPWTTFEEETEDSDDEPKYFASTASPDASPALRPSKAPATGPKKMTDRAGYVLEDKEIVTRPDYQIRKCSSGAVNDALKALWAKEGLWGIWKGTNATFIHSVLVSTMEAWSTSFLSAVLSLPDPGVTDVAHSSHPMASLAVAVAATALTALLLAPLDVIRTKLILTPASSKPRNLLPALRALPSYFIPPGLILPTTLHAVVPSFISLATPYFLKTKLGLDPLLTPSSWSLCGFLSTSLEIAVRLPLETVLRRAQIAEAKPERTIVPVGRYAGVVGTAWVLMKEEERGKWGIEGLYRGWRVMAWSNAGVLGLGVLGVQGGTTHEF